LFVTLIPKGQETEMMGIFLFTGQILGWLPPLIATLMIEAGINPRWSFCQVMGFCFAAVILTLPMGSYMEAIELASSESEQKLAEVYKATVEQDDAIKETTTLTGVPSKITSKANFVLPPSSTVVSDT
jgi:hypothetical protein